MNELNLIYPEWDVPAHITAFCSTRDGGVSSGGYSSLNLADHVGDNPVHVKTNRARLVGSLRLPQQPQWLQQTHSIRVIDLDKVSSRDGDAAITSTAGTVAVVLTADCLPVLFCNADGSEVAAAHAGWRGLLNGVLEQTVAQMNATPGDLQAWLGPAIGAQHFEVGEEVRQAFVEHTPSNNAYFAPNRRGHYLADLYAIARKRLNKVGISHISGGSLCTYQDSGAFFSYRRDRETGRQASMIYINK